MKTVRLFVSSPGDVLRERQIAECVVARLNAELSGQAWIEPELLRSGLTAGSLAERLGRDASGVDLLLCQALTHVADLECERQRAQGQRIADDLRREGRLADAERCERMAKELKAQPARLALVVDQLEEIFSCAGITPELRQRFVAALGALARSGWVWVLATLRSDFFARCSESPELMASAKEGVYHLEKPTPSEIAQMIRLPALAAGVRFEGDDQRRQALDETIRDAAMGSPEALPKAREVRVWDFWRDVDAKSAERAVACLRRWLLVPISGVFVWLAGAIALLAGNGESRWVVLPGILMVALGASLVWMFVPRVRGPFLVVLGMLLALCLITGFDLEKCGPFLLLFQAVAGGAVLLLPLVLRQLRVTASRNAEDAMREDPRSPVLYLRSFKDDLMPSIDRVPLPFLGRTGPLPAVLFWLRAPYRQAHLAFHLAFPAQPCYYLYLRISHLNTQL